jgi:hypothetical protein
MTGAAGGARPTAKTSEFRESYLSDAPRIQKQSSGTGEAVATQKSNVIKFPQPINPERKVDIRIVEQFLEKIDGLIMKGLRRDLAAVEARVLAGDAGAAEDAEFLFLSISCRLRDRDAIRREVIAWIFRVHDGARATSSRGGQDRN